MSEMNCYDWANAIAAKNNHYVLRLWLTNKEEFFNTYLFMDQNDGYLSIGNKKTGRVYTFEKVINNFKIQKVLERPTTKKIFYKSVFKIGDFRIVKKNESYDE